MINFVLFEVEVQAAKSVHLVKKISMSYSFRRGTKTHLDVLVIARKSALNTLSTKN